MTDAGFVPPPYPYERLDALKRLADCAAGRHRRLLDRHAVRSRFPRSRRVRLPARSTRRWAIPPRRERRAARRGRAAGSRAGSVSRSTPRADRRVRRHQGVRRVAAAPAAPAQPGARHRPVSRRSRTRRTRWARCSPAAARCPCRVDADWHLDLDAVADADAERALLLWVNEPGNPTSSVADAARFARDRRVGPGARHRRRERRVLRRVRARARDDPERRHSTACSRCTACRSARTWPACACGFYAGDPGARRRTSSRPASTPGSWCRPRCRRRRPPRSATTSTSPSSARATRSAASS